MSEIRALGGNVFGGNVAAADAPAILDRFVEAGGTTVDTADVHSAWQALLPAVGAIPEGWQGRPSNRLERLSFSER